MDTGGDPAGLHRLVRAERDRLAPSDAASRIQRRDEPLLVERRTLSGWAPNISLRQRGRPSASKPYHEDRRRLIGRERLPFATSDPCRSRSNPSLAGLQRVSGMNVASCSSNSASPPDTAAPLHAGGKHRISTRRDCRARGPIPCCAREFFAAPSAGRSGPLADDPSRRRSALRRPPGCPAGSASSCCRARVPARAGRQSSASGSRLSWE